MKRILVPDDITTPYSRQDSNARLLQYASSSTTENYDAFLTHHALVYILSGMKQIKVADSVFQINTGELLLIPRGEYAMSEYVAGKDGFQSIMLFLNPKVARQVIDGMKEQLPPPSTGRLKKEAIKIIPQQAQMRELYQSLINYSTSSSPFLPQIIHLKFMELIYMLLNTPHKKTILSFLLDAARYEQPTIASVLERYIYSPLTVEKLAKLSGRSLSNFKREFAKQYGIPPKKWFYTKRLERAAFLLKTSDRSIEELSANCGFASSTHFARLFKRHYCTTPTKYRTEQCLKEPNG